MSGVEGPGVEGSFANITALPAVTTPAATDVFAVEQADGVLRKETRAQIHALESGEHLILPQVDETAAPTLAFGDGDTGFYEPADGTIAISIEGTTNWRIFGGVFRAENGTGPAIVNEAATVTNPTLIPNRADFDTGMGIRAANIGVLIAGAQNCLEFGEAGSAPLFAVYGTAAIAQQTGVAVSAAGIHAACVALGLFTGP